MIQKTMKFTLCVVLIVALLVGTTYAEKETTKVSKPSSVDAQYAIMVEASTGNVMWSKNAHKKTYPASTTKLMTAILFYEENKDNMNKTFTVGKELEKLPAGSSLMGLKEGQQVTAEQLMHGLMLVSGNDAALVMAENSGGQSGFVEKMNQRAKEYGMYNTHFMNPHGFHNPEHYTTAADFAKLARQFYKNDYLMNIAQVKEFKWTNAVGEPETLYNTNRLLSGREKDKAYNFQYANGMKTGYTDSAKNCFISSAAKDGNHIILVTFGSSNSDVRFSDAKALLNYGLTNFSPEPIYNHVKDAKVNVGYQDLNMKEYEYGVFDCMVQINSEEIVNMDNDVLKRLQNGEEVTAKFNVAENLTYPLKEGDIIGDVEYLCGEDVIYSTKALSSKYVLARQIPTLFSSLRWNQANELDEKPYFEQMLGLGIGMVKNDPSKLENDQKEKEKTTQATTTTTQQTTTTSATTTKATTTTAKSTSTKATTTSGGSSTSSKATTSSSRAA